MGGLGSNLDLTTFRSQSPRNPSIFPAKAALTNASIPWPASAKDVLANFIVPAAFIFPYFFSEFERCVTQREYIPSCLGRQLWGTVPSRAALGNPCSTRARAYTDGSNMITAPQLRSARALLGIDQLALAERAQLSVPTIQRMEAMRWPHSQQCRLFDQSRPCARGSGNRINQ